MPIGKAWDACLDPQTKAVTLKCGTIVFENIILAALVFVGVLAIFMIVFAGIKYITSGGDPKQVEGAKSTLTWAIVGLLLILLSFFIINIIGFITGTTEIITETGFPEAKPTP